MDETHVFGGTDFDPHPHPQNSLLRMFRLQPGLERKLLLRTTWSLQNPPTAVSRTSTPLVRTFLSDPG